QMMNSNDFFKGSPFENNNMNNKYFNGQGNKGTSTQTKERENSQRDGLLDQLGNNISDEARAGNIDPVIGRDKEVKRVVETLNRRNKNNPVLIGEPGVGKTAMAEGPALNMVAGNVPAK